MNRFADAIKTYKAAQQRVREWIEALRSGRYQKAQGYLRLQTGAEPDKVGYCCLGFPETEHAEPELERAGWEKRRPAESFVLRR